MFYLVLDPGDKNQENGGFNLTEGQQNTHNSNKNGRAWTLLIIFLLDMKIDSLNRICCFSFCVVSALSLNTLDAHKRNATLSNAYVILIISNFT